MIRVQYLSDLHLELLKDETRPVPHKPEDLKAIAERLVFTDQRPVFWLPDTNADIIVLAGDIDVGTRGVEWAILESQVLGKPILYVPGNHEYYGGEMDAVLSKMRAVTVGTNVCLLDRGEMEFAGTRFLGTTLWTDYRADESNTPPEAAMRVAQQQIRDHRRIRFGDTDRFFTPEDALALHKQARDWLGEQLSRSHDGPTVVITHHGPSPACQHPEYPLGPISAAFHSDLEALMGPSVDLWIYGHTHACQDVAVRGTRVVSNQMGYPRETVPGFDPKRAVEV